MSSLIILKIHNISVTVFLVFYLLKTFFLLSGKSDALERFSKNTKVAEMIFSTLFLVTGIWLFVIIGGIKTLQLVKLVLVFSAIPLAIIGFKRKNKILALLSFVLLISSYGLAEASRSKPFSIKHAPENLSGNSIAAGQFIFENNCSQCHGTDGKKMYSEAADLSLSVKDASMTEAIVRNRSNKKMPSYASLLSDEELNSVTQYIMTLRVQ
ncbi:MAG: c-type cytochrome [Bacteroidia bacterium]|nr:c-type cytochrome [Bacteroidia bacterium]